MTGSILSDQDLVKRIYFPALGDPDPRVQSFGNTFFAGSPGRGSLLLRHAAARGGLSWPAIPCARRRGRIRPGLVAAALNVRFRDVDITPFAMQTLLFLTPVIYPATLLPDAWRLVYAVNPAVGIIGGLRWSPLGIPPDPSAILISTTTALGLLLAGLWCFARSEATFADVI